MKPLVRPLLVSLGCALALSAADLYALDWKPLQADILDYYSALLRIDTSNPPWICQRRTRHVGRARKAGGSQS
jgi:hypothetical protein